MGGNADLLSRSAAFQISTFTSAGAGGWPTRSKPQT
jgi:hypothetical protein